jgi:hypothetical protein
MKGILTSRNVASATVFTLILGVLSSALWDIVFKPGLTQFGRFVLDTMTLGSSALKDLAYASAALDPTPLPALIGILIASTVPFALFGILLAIPIADRIVGQTLNQLDALAEKPTAEFLREQIAKLRRLRRWMVGIGSVFLLVLGCITVTAFSVLNQSVVIWRVFHANVRICGPFISEKDDKKFRARFAAVKSKNDYVSIANDLAAIAKTNSVSLVPYNPW